MLVSMKRMLAEARQRGEYVPAFNVYNLETAQAALIASAQAQKPVILAFGASYLDNASLEVMHAIAERLSQSHPCPVALHLDHCRDLKLIRDALQAGFTSVMYDGSRLPLNENIANTLEARRLADLYDASLEGELGGLNDEAGGEGELAYTDAAQAKQYVGQTKVDCLAVSVGNAHGLYHGEPHIDISRLREIYMQTGIPLVLHGSSGIKREVILKAASVAVAKINVNTEVAMAGAAALRDALQTEARMEKPMVAARAKMSQVMEGYY